MNQSPPLSDLPGIATFTGSCTSNSDCWSGSCLGLFHGATSGSCCKATPYNYTDNCLICNSGDGECSTCLSGYEKAVKSHVSSHCVPVAETTQRCTVTGGSRAHLRFTYYRYEKDCRGKPMFVADLPDQPGNKRVIYFTGSSWTIMNHEALDCSSTSGWVSLPDGTAEYPTAPWTSAEWGDGVVVTCYNLPGLPPSTTASPTTTNPADKAPTTSYTYAFTEGSFGSCSESCGGGTRTRTVTCLRSDGQAVADTMCSGTKPSTSDSCNNQSCNTTSSASKLAQAFHVIAFLALAVVIY